MVWLNKLLFALIGGKLRYIDTNDLDPGWQIIRHSENSCRLMHRCFILESRSIIKRFACIDCGTYYIAIQK